MRLVLLAAVVSSSVVAAAPTASKAELTARTEWCSRAIDVTQQFDRCARPVNGVGYELSVLRELRDGPESDPETVRALTGTCVEYLQRSLASAERQSCKVVMPAKQREELGVFLKAWFGARTQPVPTGNTELDRQLTALAKARDEICACRDGYCVDAKRDGFDEVLMAITEASAARRVLIAVTDEASRCAFNGLYGVYPPRAP